MIKILGMSPVDIGAPEVYEAASKNTIDGAQLSITTYVSSKIYEKLPFIFMTGMLPGELAVVVNLDQWNKLTPELQGIVKGARGDAVKWNISRQKTEEEKAYSFLKQQPGVTVYAPPAEVTAEVKTKMDVFWTDYEKKYGAEGKEVTKRLRTALGW